MSFGYSVGDFLGGANLTYRLIRTLSDSRGACAEYQEAVTELRLMEDAFIQAGNLVRSNMFTRDVINGVACIVLSSAEIIEKFFDRTQDLQRRLGHGRNHIESSWSKVGWQFFGKDELRTLKKQLHERLTSINTLIATASYRIEMPPAVTQYEDKSIEDGMNDDAKTEKRQSPGSLSISQWQEDPSTSTGVTPSTAGSQETVQALPIIRSLEIGQNLRSCAHSPNGNTSTSQNKNGFLNFQDNVSLVHTTPPPDLPVSLVVEESRDLEVKLEAAIPTRGVAEKAAAERLAKDIQEQKRLLEEMKSWTEEVEMSHRVKTQTDVATPRRETKSQAELEREIRAKVTAGDYAATTDAQLKEKKEVRKGAAEAKAKETKAPIRFKDAVGRKFSFPYHLAQTWQGMEDLIKQAFLHVDVIGPHVRAGHYDLIGPDGEIILPQVWDKVIKPDWAVTMHMWPMGQRPPLSQMERRSIPAPFTGLFPVRQQPPPPVGALTQRPKKPLGVLQWIGGSRGKLDRKVPVRAKQEVSLLPNQYEKPLVEVVQP
ncbi:hypothetical protein F4677DRAFT_445220 [Hypoxylon crocopeplum]|nr:hypothetical protein F4677DRAFT_445220 [Hypoxylon crocopeplum]